MLTRFRKVALLMAYAVATIPLWHYIRDGRILALMVAVVTFAYINVVLSTVEAAQPILSSEKAKTPLPRWLPDKPKYHKWWMLVRHTLKWHLLLIPPKMGLALGFAEWFYIVEKNVAYSLLNPYFYTSNTYPGTSTFPQFAVPQWETGFIALCFLISFSVVEMALTNSIIITSQARIPHLIVKRIAVILILTGIVPVISTVLWEANNCENCLIDPSPIYFNRRAEDTVILATNSLVEQGILLSANIMRPIGEYSSFTVGWSDYKKPDNRPFVARQIVAGVGGLLLYTGATWVVLWFVEDETVPK